jgi:hypothetical protein
VDSHADESASSSSGNIDSDTGEPYFFCDPGNTDGFRPAEDALDEIWECDVLAASACIFI